MPVRLLALIALALALPMYAEEAPVLEAPALPAVLDLKTAQELALAQNPSLQAVEEMVLQARERVKQARSAYFPQVQAAYTATYTALSDETLESATEQVRQQVVSGLGQSLGRAFSSGGPNPAASAGIGALFSLYTGSIAYDMIDSTVERHNASLTANYLVFDGFARRFRLAQARFGAEETEAARLEAQRLVLDAVAKAFYGVQLARENVSIFEADAAFNTRLLEDAKARRAGGIGSLSDELNFEVLLRAARGQLIAAEGEHRAARIALAALMGLPEAGLPDSVEIAPLESESAEDMTLPELEPLLARALDLRPDVDQQDFASRRAKAAVGQKKGAYYPQVGAFASADAARTGSARIDGDDIATTVGVNVKYDLFTGGRNRAAVAEARHAAREAEARRADAALNAQAEVRTAVERLRTGQAGLLLQRTAAEFVAKNRDLVEKEYNAGQTALVRLNQAQRDLVEAEARLALARVNLRAAWHGLRTATGETVAGGLDDAGNIDRGS